MPVIYTALEELPIQMLLKLVEILFEEKRETISIK